MSVGKAAMAAAVVAAAGVAHVAPAVAARGPLRARLLPRLLGVGAAGGVALTFDDGPDPRGTPAVLDVLGELGWPATFFFLGDQVRRYPVLVRQVVDAGHEVAVHGWSHRNHLTRGPLDLLADLSSTRDLLDATAGARPRWFRPPYGVLTAGSLAASRVCRLRPVLWTAWGRDWEGTTTPSAVARVVRDQLRDRGTVLLHDSDCTSAPGSWRATAASLPLLAEDVAARGWAVRTLSEHLGQSC